MDCVIKRNKKLSSSMIYSTSCSTMETFINNKRHLNCFSFLFIQTTWKSSTIKNYLMKNSYTCRKIDREKAQHNCNFLTNTRKIDICPQSLHTALCKITIKHVVLNSVSIIHTASFFKLTYNSMTKLPGFYFFAQSEQISDQLHQCARY